MRSLFEVPPPSSVPPVDLLPRTAPAAWQGMPLSWTHPPEVEPVYITTFKAGTGSPTDDVHLFGVRYDLAHVLVGGDSLGDGYFLEFMVAERLTSPEWVVHRLLQQHSVVFSCSGESEDYVSADEIPKGIADAKAPRWEDSGNATWPTCDGPMRFVGQVSLPETGATRTLFTWDITLYLFVHPRGGQYVFKLVEQTMGDQDIREHYDTEEREA